MRILRSLIILVLSITAGALALGGAAWISVDVLGFDEGTLAGLIAFGVLFLLLGMALFYPVFHFRNFLDTLMDG